MTMTETVAPAPIPGERTLLIVEDDKAFLTRLARAMEARGFTVTVAESVADGLLQVEKAPPFYAVVDMRLGDGNGLDVISALRKRRPEAHGIVLTGYGNIATAVNAVKLGAIEPNVAWELGLASFVLGAFLAALALWLHTALRRANATQDRRTAYISSALNSLGQGVVVTDPKGLIAYVNDRYLEIYGLQRSDITPGMTGRGILELRISLTSIYCGHRSRFRPRSVSD